MPIDIATGNVELDREDFSLPGRVPIKWTRSYRSTLLESDAGVLGGGWTSSWFPTLKRSGNDWIFTNRVGAQNIFVDPEADVLQGKTVRLPGNFLELSSKGQDLEVLSWDVDTGEIERFVFAPGSSMLSFNLIAIENVSGDRVDVNWNPSGQIASLYQQIENRTIYVRYLSNGKMASLSLDGAEGDSALVRYEYDLEGRLVAVINRRGFAHRYEYDAQSRLKRELLPDGAVYTYKYDDQNRCIHFTGLDHYNEKRLRFLDPVGTTIVTNSYGVIKTFTALPSGQITSEASPTGARSENKYDEFGRLIAKIDALGATTTYTYDELGNRNSITDPLGNVTKFTFNKYHQPTTMIDATGQVWKKIYNNQQRLTETINPLGARWTMEYDTEGNPVQVTEPQGFIRRLNYERGLLRESTDFMANKSTFAWDGFGRLIERIGPVGDRTGFAYDFSGNIIQVDQPDGSSLRAAYDAGNNLSSFTGAKGYNFQFRYGSCHRLLERTDALGRTVRYEWGSEPDRLDVVINEKSERYTYTRDDEGRIVNERSFNDRQNHFIYDNAGRCITFINGNEEKIQFKRDLLGRLVEQIIPTGETTTFKYDPVGRIVSAINPDVEVKFEYNPAGQPIRESQNEHWIKSSYNLSGELIGTHSSLGHEVNYELDANGKVVKLTTAKDQTLVFERDACGREISRSMPGNTRLEQSYDLMGRLVSQRVGKTKFSPFHLGKFSFTHEGKPGGDHFQRDYVYDPDGWLLEIQDKRWGSIEYTYDPAERLLSAFKDLEQDERFEYDQTDNMVHIQQRKVELHDSILEIGIGNCIVRRGNTTYEFDNDGRLLCKIEQAENGAQRLWRFRWDAQGQLLGFTHPDGAQWEYKYDPFGRRIAKIGPESKVTFVWNGDVVLHELTDAGQIVAWITERDSFAVVAKVLSGTLLSVINDHLGTPKEMVGANGQIVKLDSQLAWGAISQINQSRSEFECPIRFQGQWYDAESGLHYNRFRYYDPGIARYLSEDPIGIAGGLNLYHYANNPTRWVDPFGLQASIDENGFFAKSNEYGRGSGSGVVRIPYQGTRGRDFTAANNAAGFARTPDGYTWHHANYNARTGYGDMQLVRTDVHGTTPHAGGVSDFTRATGIKYDTPEAVQHVDDEGRLLGRPCAD